MAGRLGTLWGLGVRRLRNEGCGDTAHAALGKFTQNPYLKHVNLGQQQKYRPPEFAKEIRKVAEQQVADQTRVPCTGFSAAGASSPTDCTKLPLRGPGAFRANCLRIMVGTLIVRKSKCF